MIFLSPENKCKNIICYNTGKKVYIIKNYSLALFLALACAASLEATNNTPHQSNGIDYPSGWQNWQTIAVSHRTDNKTLRVILGNDIAIKASRQNKTNPWPNGTVLAKVVWKDTISSEWKEATVPGKFVHAEFMIKDDKKYAKTKGWGWARWVSLEKKPFNKGMQVCINCHIPVKKNDWVYTKPAKFPL